MKVYLHTGESIFCLVGGLNSGEIVQISTEVKELPVVLTRAHHGDIKELICAPQQHMLISYGSGNSFVIYRFASQTLLSLRFLSYSFFALDNLIKVWHVTSSSQQRRSFNDSSLQAHLDLQLVNVLNITPAVPTMVKMALLEEELNILVATATHAMQCYTFVNDICT
jgi:hypothetical protein